MNGSGTATVFEGRRRTWAEVQVRVARLATGLRSLGVDYGERVAILAHGSDRYFELYLAIWWAGAVAVPLNTRWARAELSHAMDEAEPRVLAFDASFVDAGRQLLARGRPCAGLWLGDAAPAAPLPADAATGGRPRSEAPRNEVAAAAPASMATHEALATSGLPMPDARAAGEALAGIFYTGGTTGRPKGVMLSHRALFSNVLVSQADAPFDEQAVLLHHAPLFHLGGLSFLLRGLMRAARQVILPAFTPAAVLEAIERERVTHTFAVPTMLRMLLDAPEFAARDLSSLRALSYGSSPITETLARRLVEALPGVDIFQGYGMTELTAAVTFLAPRHHTAAGLAGGKLRSAGQAKTGIDVRIQRADGSEAAPGEVGEIVVRSPCVMSGYWRQPEATAAVLRDGWMHTGDAAFMDEDGYVFIVDRLKDMIVSGAENVYSAEVEQALASHPAVAQAAVIGIPHPAWGEAVHAVVVPRAGQAVDAQALIEHCRGLIAKYKCPRSVELRDTLPLSAAGKVLKQELRAPWWRDTARRVQ